MKKEWADKWIAALRSGKYKQGKNHLRTDDKYCCLGVLCEIAGEEEYESTVVTGRFLYGNLITGGIHSDELPVSTQHLVGMKTNVGMRGPGGDLEEPDTLAKLNDAGYTFEEIADRISEEWENL